MLNEETKRKLRIMNMNPVIDIVDQQDCKFRPNGAAIPKLAVHSFR